MNKLKYIKINELHNKCITKLEQAYTKGIIDEIRMFAEKMCGYNRFYIFNISNRFYISDTRHSNEKLIWGGGFENSKTLFFSYEYQITISNKNVVSINPSYFKKWFENEELISTISNQKIDIQVIQNNIQINDGKSQLSLEEFLNNLGYTLIK